MVPQRQAGFRRELTSFVAWYNEHRPHTTLRGKTPNEVYFHMRPANQRPRIGLGMQKGPRETDPRRPHFLRDASDHASDIALSFFVASIQTLLAKGDTLQKEATNNVVFTLSLQSPRSQEA